MSRLKRSAVGMGLCVLGLGACVCASLAGELAAVDSDVVADSLRLSTPMSELRSAAWKADGGTLDGSILVAQAEGGGSGVFVGPNGAGGASVGVSQGFSTWSDITAVFRPSRWMNPFREGGPLSWLNYRAWGDAPGRTAKVLLGEAIVAGATLAIIHSTEGHHRHDDGGTDTTPPPSASSRSDTSSSSSSFSSSSDTSSSSSSSSSSGDTSSSSSSGDTSSSSSGEVPF